MQTTRISQTIMLLIAAFVSSAATLSAHGRDPIGKYCGELLSAGVMSRVETRFIRNVANGTITGSYVFDDPASPPRACWPRPATMVTETT